MQAERHDNQQQKRSQRKSNIKVPVVQAAGPKPPWPWQRSAHFAAHDFRDENSHATMPDGWLERIMHALLEFSVLEILQILTEQPYTGKVATMITRHFAQTIGNLPEAATVELHGILQEAITLWQSNAFHGAPNACLPVRLGVMNRSLQDLRPSQHVPPSVQPHNLDDQRHSLIDDLWNQVDVAHQLTQQINKEHDRRFRADVIQVPPLIASPVFLYVFAGRRREGDFQVQVESYLRQRNLTGRVLLLDLAISARHDVTDRTLVRTILNWITTGAVAGVLLAPPCETWSSARQRYLLDGGPRPLRSHKQPMCLPQLTKKELIQVTISNFLLYVAIRCMLACVMHSIPCVKEHPCEPRQREYPSIWRLPWLQHLEKTGLICRTKVWQAMFGAKAAKPTHLAHCHIVALRQILRPHEQPVDWAALELLVGRDTQGAWKTSYAKEYPPDFNRALADVFITAFEQRMQQQTGTHSPTAEFEEQLRYLTEDQYNMEDQTMQPDFHMPRRPQGDLDEME